MAASNSDFIPDNVYVELYYRSPGKPTFTKIAKPFTTPAAIHKAVMLDNPDYKLENLQTSEAFNKWLYDDSVEDRVKKARNDWWEKIDDLTRKYVPQIPSREFNPEKTEKFKQAYSSEQEFLAAGGRYEPINIVGTVNIPAEDIVPDFLAHKINALDTAVDKAKTDKAGAGLAMIPFYSILEIGKIFVEGLRYGRDNWKKGVNDLEWQDERLDHALLHLAKWKEGYRTENHLAKVAWFCVVQLELERLERDNTPS